MQMRNPAVMKLDVLSQKMICIDFDGMERSILAKVKDLSGFTDLLEIYCLLRVLVELVLDTFGDVGFGLEYDSTDQMITNDSDSSSEMSSTSRLMREVDVCGVDSDHVDSFEEGEILEDHFDGDRGNDTIEDNADLNPSPKV
ncbi:hypothetical protein Tco_1112023 [Tanacetum coccineum]|uniref:Uncharacterized protein n=1 Tax=Tanacetum coccineum TaxID=301880 RepID=A0ABQ5IPN9_9ASTR